MANGRTSSEGSKRRRLLEFQVIVEQVKRDKARFIRRLRGLVRSEGACVLFLGSQRYDGYARMNFRYKGRHVQIDAQRVFLILKLCRQIKLGHDAGHEPCCPHRHCVLHVFEQPVGDNARMAVYERRSEAAVKRAEEAA